MPADDEGKAEGTDDGPEQDERDVGEGRQCQRQRVVGPPVLSAIGAVRAPSLLPAGAL